MPDLLDIAIEEAVQTPQAAELMRASKRFEELRTSPAWLELREEMKLRRELVVRVLGEKALKGVDPARLHDEGIYARGFLDAITELLERPFVVEQKLEHLIHESYEKLRSELIEATLEASPYA